MGPLDRLPGTWDLTMHHADTEEPVVGRHRYEWVLDEAFLQLRVAYERPDFPDAMALFSPERCYYFDVRGVARVFDLTLDADGWSTTNVTDGGLSQRATTRFVDDDTRRGDRRAVDRHRRHLGAGLHNDSAPGHPVIKVGSSGSRRAGWRTRPPARC